MVAGLGHGDWLQSIVDVRGLPLARTPCLVADTRGDGMWYCAARWPVDGDYLELPVPDDGRQVPYDGGLLHRNSAGLWQIVSPWEGLGSMSVVDLAADPATGDLLAATAGGIARLALTQVPVAPTWTVHLPIAHNRVTAPLDNDEYAVYRAAIQATFPDSRYDRFVIADRTVRYDLGGERGYRQLRASMPSLDRHTYDDFVTRNATRWPLTDAFGLITPVVLLGDSEATEIFDAGGWAEFYRRFPNTQGHMVLSRVGFSDDRRKALLYLGNQSNYLAGAGYAMVFEWSGAAWSRVASWMLWIS